MIAKSQNSVFTKKQAELARASAAKTAKRFEEQYGVRCILVENPYRPNFGEVTLTFSLIICPQEGKREDKDFEVALAHIDKEENQLDTWISRKYWAWHRTRLDTFDMNGWFIRFKDCPEKFPLSDAAMGADLLSPVVYGEELMEVVRNEARKFFGDNIFNFWEESLFKGLEKRQADIAKDLALETRDNYLKSKILIERELEDIRRFCFELKGLVQKDSRVVFIALDGSGRPLGKVLKWFLGSGVKVFHISPHHLRHMNFNHKEVVKNAVGTLKLEKSELYEIWSSEPSRLIFLDDQMASGHTYETLVRFTEVLSGRKKVHMRVFSEWNGENIPTWWHRRNVQGIRVLPHFSFLVKNVPTEASKKFYSRLYRHVRKWKKEQFI